MAKAVSGYEPLESRLLLSSATVTELGVLRVIGDLDVANTIVVGLSADQTKFDVTINSEAVQSFDVAGVNAISIKGRNGNDTISIDETNGAPGVAVIIRGGLGNDSLTGSSGRDLFLAGDGNDTVNAGGGDDFVHGGAGDDSILAGDGRDVVFAGQGNDTVLGEGGNDFLFGQLGDDSMDGGAGNDRLLGMEGSDTLNGGEGDDKLFGGAGADSLDGGAGTNKTREGEKLTLADLIGRLQGEEANM